LIRCGNYIVGGYGTDVATDRGVRQDVPFLPDEQLSEQLGLPH
jgi:hypothetical protein